MSRFFNKIHYPRGSISCAFGSGISEAANFSKKSPFLFGNGKKSEAQKDRNRAMFCGKSRPCRKFRAKGFPGTYFPLQSRDGLDSFRLDVLRGIQSAAVSLTGCPSLDAIYV
jgi:hypothetical protein